MHVYRCPHCRQIAPALIKRYRTKAEKAIVARLQSLTPAWNPAAGLCERCLYLNEFPTLAEHFASVQNGSVFRSRLKNEFALLPTALRLNADPRFTGRGVTIAFIDSGFFPHPDLLKPRKRIKAIVDVTDEARTSSYFSQPHPESWHGTMTSVAAAGSGSLSRGLYRGLAPEASVVLIKVLDTRTGRINTENITRGLRWAMDNRKRYGINIISLSVGDDDPATLEESPVDQAAEEAVKAGIVVVAASGNNPSRAIVPPASSPSVITIGGLDDKNQLLPHLRTMYHSTYGTTVDGYRKPELIAPAIWVAGAILPGTDQFLESKVLFRLLNASPTAAARLFEDYRGNLATAPKTLMKGDYKGWCRERIAEMKYVAPFYKHIDGTSFAAPIVSSLIAQMIQACPHLKPAEVKAILLKSADLLPDIPEDQQGFGVPNPRKAISAAMRARSRSIEPGIHKEREGVAFIYKNPDASSVCIAGEFNGWNQYEIRCHEVDEGLWSCWLRSLEAGTYSYKYIVDGEWRIDPTNDRKIPDGYGGWNSVVVINS